MRPNASTIAAAATEPRFFRSIRWRTTLLTRTLQPCLCVGIGILDLNARDVTMRQNSCLVRLYCTSFLPTHHVFHEHGVADRDTSQTKTKGKIEMPFKVPFWNRTQSGRPGQRPWTQWSGRKKDKGPCPFGRPAQVTAFPNHYCKLKMNLVTKVIRHHELQFGLQGKA